MLKVRNLRRAPIGPVSFMLPAGAIGIVTGPSGAGKSLLARAIVDLDPNQGTVSWRGRDRETMPAPAWRRMIAYVPAESGWWAERVINHFPPQVDQDRLKELLAAVGLPQEALQWAVSRASTGERQRLAFIRALMNAPEVMILDEPTSALDEVTRRKMEDVILAERRERGRTFLVITHDSAQATRLGDVFWRLEEGRLSEDAAPMDRTRLPDDGGRAS